MTASFSTVWHILRALSFPLLLVAWCGDAKAGAPFVTDDPGIPEQGQFDLYLFTNGAVGEAGDALGLELNYAATGDLQLTASIPTSNEGGGRLGNSELAAKYRFVRQEDFGWDVAVAPRLFLPSTENAGSKIFIPVWLGRNFGKWSTFGGGGCAINDQTRGRNYCLGGGAVTYEVSRALSMGAEVFRQGAESAGDFSSTGIGVGLQYAAGKNLQLLTSLGPRFEDVTGNTEVGWYISLLLSY